MEDYLGEIRQVTLKPMRMASAQRIGAEPENEVIEFITNWANKHGIDHKSTRSFGFDIPVADAEKQKGHRGYEYWIAIPEGIGPEPETKLVDFTGGEYITLRINDPFVDPFDRIPKGWQHLVAHIRSQNLMADFCTVGSCLEEVVTENGVTCMDILIRLKK